MSDQLELIRGVLAHGDGAGAEYRWEDVEDALWQITAVPPAPEVEKTLVKVLRFKGRLHLTPSSELPHSMSPEEMLKSMAIQALGKWTGLAYLQEMQRIQATANSPVLAGIARAVIREATQAEERATGSGGEVVAVSWEKSAQPVIWSVAREAGMTFLPDRPVRRRDLTSVA